MSKTGPKTERLTILRAASHETELGDHDFCLSRSHVCVCERERGRGCVRENHTELERRRIE